MAVKLSVCQVPYTVIALRPLTLAMMAGMSLIGTTFPAAGQTPNVTGPNDNVLDRIPSPVEPTLPSVEPLEPEPLPPDVMIEGTPPDSEAVSSETDETDCPPLTSASEDSFTVTEIEIVGSTTLTQEISTLVDCYVDQPITLADLLTLRSRITQLYLEAGYITSGAFLPTNQDLSDGRVQIQVLEGRIEDIQINGLNRLGEGYVRERLARAVEPPLNQRDLEEGLQLLQIDPLLERVNAELAQGSTPGLSLLIVDLQEAAPFDITFSVDNYRSPSVGSEEGVISAGYNNIFGVGDRLSASLNFSSGLTLYDIQYVVPINAADGTVRVRFDNSDSRIVEEPFDDIGIRSDTQTISVGVRQPLWRSPAEEFAIGLDFDWRESQSFILDDIPFSFSVGPEAGRSQVNVLRFYQDWVKRDTKRVLAARSQFSLGVDIFNATVNDSGTDGRFFSWQGQFQWVEQLQSNVLILTRLNAQLTPDSLLPIERFSVGGISTVRGYIQNQLVTDNAVTGSLEFRIPLSADVNELQLTPFVDFGAGWNNQTSNPDPSFLLGTGLGVRWKIAPGWFARVDYGIPLVDANNQSNNLQASGLYLFLSYTPTY